MLAYTLLFLIACLVLGLTTHRLFLVGAALAFTWLVVMAIVWVWLVATRRRGFLGRRL